VAFHFFTRNDDTRLTQDRSLRASLFLQKKITTFSEEMRRHFFLFRRNNNTRPAEETKWHASLFLQKKITASLFLQKKMERLILSSKKKITCFSEEIRRHFIFFRRNSYYTRHAEENKAVCLIISPEKHKPFLLKK
jgi:hypothetical protein